MAKRKTYKEPETLTERSEFFTFCSSLSIATSESWDVNQLSTLLNSQFSKHAEVNSPIDTLWKTARSNIDLLTSSTTRSSLLSKVTTHPIISGIVATIIGGLLLYFLVKGIEAL
jgi:hypothetical protein